ncbi:protein Jumonji [Amyelois transitella]|uniref:protein Jumonji n=1 Tax=Amyelois transitella TaxID=680683 RepID=UPI00298FE87A|nr:protein Jumonji [Amyelois transitella]
MSSKFRKVQAQRKFAQGAYIPPHHNNNVSAERRCEGHEKPAPPPAIVQNMSAVSLLDQVSFHNLHYHDRKMQPVVRLERLPRIQPDRTPRILRRVSIATDSTTAIPLLYRRQVWPHSKLGLRNRVILKKNPRQLSKKKVSRNLRTRRMVTRRKRTCCRDDTDTEDETPLKYLAASSPLDPPGRSFPKDSDGPSTSKDSSGFYSADNIERWISGAAQSTSQFKVPLPPRPKAAKHPGRQFQRDEMLMIPTVEDSMEIPEIPPSPSNAGCDKIERMSPTISTSSCYQQNDDEDQKVEPESLVTVAPCPSERYVTIKDVVNASQEERKLRCSICDFCKRAYKVEQLSQVFRESADDGEASNMVIWQSKPSRSSDDKQQTSNYVYLDILPGVSNLVIQIQYTVIPNQKKPILQARIVSKSEAESINECNLIENESLFEQLVEFLDAKMLKRYRTILLDALAAEKRSAEGETSRPKRSRPKLKAKITRKVAARGKPYDFKSAAKLTKFSSNSNKYVDNSSNSAVNSSKSAVNSSKSAVSSSKSAVSTSKFAASTSKSAVNSSKTAVNSTKSVVNSSKTVVNSSKSVVNSSKSAGNSNKSSASTSKSGANVASPGPAPAVAGPAVGGALPGASTSASPAAFPETPAAERKPSAAVRDAPVYYPTEQEFCDPVAYFEKIMPTASKFGICKVVAPASFKPKCTVNDKIRFNVANQYVARLYTRWGPASREMCAIKAHLASQRVPFTRSPILDSLEVDLPKLYHTVQKLGGLKKVIEKKLWGRVAENMRFSKRPQLEKRLDDIYVRYLLPYDTLSTQERDDIRAEVNKGWYKKNTKIVRRSLNPLHRQKQLLGESGTSASDTEDESDVAGALTEAEDCIVSGRRMTLANFMKVAQAVKDQYFPDNPEPTPREVEDEYWRIVLLAQEHICVNTASIDTGEEGYGFPKGKQDPYGKHPWNPKMISQNPGNVLSMLGPVLGVTVPTLHLGMMFSTSCWHSDPHGLPWIEYMHSGPAKIWYGIPDDQSAAFRGAVESLCQTSCQNKSIWLPSDITMIPPHFLLLSQVSLTRVEQNPGEYIIVFPKAYSSSISTGYTQSESVYFATNSWLKTVDHVFHELSDSCEPTMFSLEQLLIAVAGDPRAPASLLQLVHTTLATIVEDELQRRRDLSWLGVPITTATRPPHKKKPAGAWNDECEVCRTTLYLSKVTGLTDKKSAVCLKHAIRLLTSEKTKREITGLSLVEFLTKDQLQDVMTKLQDRFCPT